MPASGFSIAIRVSDPKWLEKNAERLLDFSALFGELRDAWVEHNKDKFEQSMGAQELGVWMDDTTFWKELSDAYLAEKEREGYEDWLMVRTGELMDGLVSGSGPDWYEDIAERRCLFGTLNIKAFYNRETRPVMFLDEEDRKAFVKLVVAYLEWKVPFGRPPSPEVRRMDAEFRALMAGS